MWTKRVRRDALSYVGSDFVGSSLGAEETLIGSPMARSRAASHSRCKKAAHSHSYNVYVWSNYPRKGARLHVMATTVIHHHCVIRSVQRSAGLQVPRLKMLLCVLVRRAWRLQACLAASGQGPSHYVSLRSAFMRSPPPPPPLHASP